MHQVMMHLWLEQDCHGNLVLATKLIGNDVFGHVPSTAFIAVAQGAGFFSSCVDLSSANLQA